MKKLEVTSLNMGKLRFDLTDIYGLPADHPYAGQIAEVPMFSYHIGLPGRSVLVDAVAYDLEEVSAALRIAAYVPPPPLLEQLSANGIEAAEVSDVIITHAHFDHYAALGRAAETGYEPAFPGARHYLSKADWIPEQFDALEERTLELVEQRGLLDLVEGEVDLGDGMTILPMPGETPGHQILHLEGERQSLYFAGDLYHHQVELADAFRHVRWAASSEMQASKAALMKRAANDGGWVYFTHITGPFRVVQHKDQTLAWQSF